MAALEGIEFATIVRVVVIALSVAGVVLCAILALTSRERLRSTHNVRIGFIDLPAISHYKLIGLFGMFLLPIAAVSLASYELFVGTKEMTACVRCHIMRPFANDMMGPDSDLPAARHFRNRWIREKQCYQCHVDYGFSGTLTAKIDGLRHLLKYTTGTFHEPIALREPFHNDNCLHCHGDTPKYDREAMHEVMADVIATDETPCTSCHGDSHPSRDRRTPGHEDYPQLIRPVEVKK